MAAIEKAHKENEEMRQDFLEQFYKKNSSLPGFKLLKNTDVDTFKMYS